MQSQETAPAGTAGERVKKTYYDRTPVETLHDFGSRREGLQDSEIDRNREVFGTNKLQEVQRKSLLAIFADQFKDLLVIILIAAALISFLTGERARTRSWAPSSTSRRSARSRV